MKITKCTICDSPSKLEFRYTDWDVYRCQQCFHAFSNNIKKDIEEIYNEKYFEKNWFRYPNLKLYNSIENVLYKKFGKVANVHDLGCGNGNFLHYIYEKGYHNLSGSDIISCLRKELDGKVNFMHSSFDSIEGNLTYDFVISIANIEHVSDVHEYTKILNNLLKPGGVAAIYTINENALIYWLSRLLRKFGILFASKQLYDPHHINHFSKKSLKTLLVNNDFHFLESQTSNFPLKSTDIFVDSPVARKIVLFGISIINMLSSLSKTEIGQLVFVQKK
ncbi:class I SAM-dependent methyltransferase [Opitutales bacterium]|nr:class I SAM-dependent methyltransferase [Opitutales bacterium]